MGADYFNSGMSSSSARREFDGLWSLHWREPDISAIASCRLGRRETARLAALLLFCDPVSHFCSQLAELSPNDWQSLKKWLDVSGLALYFLDRVIELKVGDLLPAEVFTQLHLNLIDNTERTRRMLTESAEIQGSFRRAGIGYAVLKGISLWPSAVPRPELRSQFDLDYLVAEEDVPVARGILEQQGYRLYAVSGRTSEFKKNERPGVLLRDIYKHFDSYGVEIHAESRSSAKGSLVDRIQWREIDGTMTPVLGRTDLFLGQALHVFKHVCGEFTRASLLLELRRHILAYRNDKAFWDEVQLRATRDQRSAVGFATAMYLTEHVFGKTVPGFARSWAVHSLPDQIGAWVRTYGLRVMLGDNPGTKLHLLLQHELVRQGIERKRSVRSVLLPYQLPPMVIRGLPNERHSVRIRRYTMQFRIVVSRLRFHVVEGLRYLVEARRWRRLAGESR
jgi:hypothetical protein